MVENIVNFIDTDFGKRPVEWSPIAISHIVTDFRGGAPLAPNDFTKMGFLVLPKGGVIRGGNLFVDKDKQQYCSFQYAERYKNNTVDKRFTIVVLRDLVPSGPNIGLMVRINNNESYLLAQGVYGFRVNEELVSPDFFIHISNTTEYRKIMRNIMVGSTQVHITNGTFLKQEIPLPPTKAEQTAIATALNDADSLITQFEKLIAKKKAMKQGAMQELLKPKEGWETKTLGEMSQFFKGKGLPKSDITIDGNTKCIHYGELFLKYNEQIVEVIEKTNSFEGCFYSKSNDVLMPTSDVTPNGLATASCINEDNVLLGGDVLIIRIPNSEVNGCFLSYYIKLNRIEIMKLVKGVTVFHLHATDMKGFILCYPKIDIQNKIAQILFDMEIEIQHLEIQLEKQKQLKQGMMQSLLTGKISLV